MSDHLPQCWTQDMGGMKRASADSCAVCAAIRSAVADALRACEARVRLHAQLDREADWREGRVAGLDAAREAVAALAPTTVEFHGPLPVVHNVRITDALTAIDSLRTTD